MLPYACDADKPIAQRYASMKFRLIARSFRLRKVPYEVACELVAFLHVVPMRYAKWVFHWTPAGERCVKRIWDRADVQEDARRSGMIEANLRAVDVDVGVAVLAAMRDGGCLLQISSATASIMLEDHAAYMGTKAGADHVIRCVANEFGHRGIRANSIAPGFTPTPMTARASRNQAILDSFAREYPLGRVGTSEDIAEAAVWIASDNCFMTGQVFQVNGGVTLRRNPTNAEIVSAVQAARAAASVAAS